MTLVVHESRTPATLEAAAGWTDRVAGLVVINGFGWRPSGPMFRGMLAIMGNPAVREVDTFTGWLIRVSATRLGSAEQWDRSTRSAYRRAMGRAQRRTFHRYMAAARRHDYTSIDNVVAQARYPTPAHHLRPTQRPARFQPKWKDRFANATQTTVTKGYHFPMCDAPELVATTFPEWHSGVLPRIRPRSVG